MQHGEIRVGLHDVWMLLRPGWPRLAQGQGGLVSEAPAAGQPSPFVPRTASPPVISSPSFLPPIPTVSVYKRTTTVAWWPGRRWHCPTEGWSAPK